MTVFRANRALWRRHRKLMIGYYALGLPLALVVLVTTGSVAWALSVTACSGLVVAFASIVIEEDRGTIDEFADEVEGRR